MKRVMQKNGVSNNFSPCQNNQTPPQTKFKQIIISNNSEKNWFTTIKKKKNNQPLIPQNKIK